MRLFDPLVSFDLIDIDEANRALVEWGHRMGPIIRPIGLLVATGLRHDGRLVAITVAADLIRESCAGKDRSEAIELARLCASRSDLCRAVLRLWREFYFPALRQQWALSYQDEGLHTGNTYRWDGWVRLARSRSGTDPRGNRRGRNKTIWGWHADPAVRAAAKMVDRVAAVRSLEP